MCILSLYMYITILFVDDILRSLVRILFFLAGAKSRRACPTDSLLSRALDFFISKNVIGLLSLFTSIT